MRHVVRLLPIVALTAAGQVLPAVATAQTTVDSVATSSSACDSSGVRGLADQLVALQLCRMPGRFEAIAPHAGVTLTSTHIHAVMVADAHDAVWAAASHVDISVNSVFRTLPEQYVLYHRSSCYTPAAPGTSPHESGLAIDVENYDASGVTSALVSAGCAHSHPTSDPVHFDCPGTPLASENVLTFQHLWNLNHPEDVISEDGSYGPQTAARLARTPADGFAIAGDCDVMPMPMADAGMPMPMADAGMPMTETDAGTSMTGTDAGGGGGGDDATMTGGDASGPTRGRPYAVSRTGCDVSAGSGAAGWLAVLGACALALRRRR